MELKFYRSTKGCGPETSRLSVCPKIINDFTARINQINLE
nr:MAG TPA: hypothetical protein [Caudoviricetes sp.]